jgi:hypothetical protein
MLYQFDVPASGILSQLQGSIPLAEGPTESEPAFKEPLFHVEHTPVQPTSTLSGCALHQPVDLRVDDLDEERGG